jgi:LAO/AO transport system kinase
LTMRESFQVAENFAGILEGDRASLARGITLVESGLDSDRVAALELLDLTLPHTGGAIRVGITGVPGVGKSTFIEVLGSHLTARGRHVAVLAVDPSSVRNGGSIMGDKTRMTELSRDPNAFVRPSPTSGSLGGVGRRSHEAMLLCEAAGYDVVLVETVGVGQSETLVADMVDFFLVLMLANAGDELQGIKRGILELADAVAINKADGAAVPAAELARAEFARAMALMLPRFAEWSVPVRTCSAATGAGIEEIWQDVEAHRDALVAAGNRDRLRADQRVRWMWRAVEDELLSRLRASANANSEIASLEAEVRSGALLPERAARRLLEPSG